jgi:hypothetical protein
MATPSAPPSASRSGEREVCGEAANGREGIEKAQQLKPDMIVLDLSMPVMNGIEAAPLLSIAPWQTIGSVRRDAYHSSIEDQGSLSSSGSRPSANTWPNLVILKSSFRRWFKLISFNRLLAALADTYSPTIVPNPELSM